MKKILLITICLLLAGCTNKEDAERALNNNGFDDVKVIGYSFFACSKDDFYHTAFIAKSKDGKEVKGVVCSGLLFKNATIRW